MFKGLRTYVREPTKICSLKWLASCEKKGKYLQRPTQVLAMRLATTCQTPRITPRNKEVKEFKDIKDMFRSTLNAPRSSLNGRQAIH